MNIRAGRCLCRFFLTALCLFFLSFLLFLGLLLCLYDGFLLRDALFVEHIHDAVDLFFGILQQLSILVVIIGIVLRIISPSGIQDAVFIQLIALSIHHYGTGKHDAVFIKIMLSAVDGLPAGHLAARVIDIDISALFDLHILRGDRKALLVIQAVAVPAVQQPAIFLKAICNIVDRLFAACHSSIRSEIITEAVDLLPAEHHFPVVIKIIRSIIQMQPSDCLFPGGFQDIITVCAFAMPSRLCFIRINGGNDRNTRRKAECQCNLLAVSF